jgi:hypothetical protein
MQNFGRGMWRRVGDFERIHKPMLIQQSRLEQLQQAYKQEPKTNILTKQIQVPSSVPKLTPLEALEDNLIHLEKNTKPETDINGTPHEIQQTTSKLPVVVPKKTNPKNK